VLTAALGNHQELQNSRPMAIFKIYYFFSPTLVSRRILLPTASIKTKVKIKSKNKKFSLILPATTSSQGKSFQNN
jgi:hypothetical protein